MRMILFLLSALAVIGSGTWAYQQHYQTKDEIDRVEALNRDIGLAHERMAMLRAEWAYLNRPDRLRDLADLNFERLGLLPLRPDHFADVDQVAFPPPPSPIDFNTAIRDPIDVTSAGASQP
jgi:hypothetical protein